MKFSILDLGCYTEYHYAECLKYALYAECHYAECHYAECHYAECLKYALYAECRYAESRGATLLALLEKYCAKVKVNDSGKHSKMLLHSGSLLPY